MRVILAAGKETFGMRHILGRIAVAMLGAALLVSLVGCGAGTSPSTTPTSTAPYKVGAILSLTGSYAGLGQPEKNTIEMEVKRLNDAGGVNGRQIEVVYEDDGTDTSKAVAAAAKLIDQDGVIAILGATGTGQSMAIRGDIDRAGIPEISMAGGNAITGTFDALVYQTPWPNSIVVPFVLDKIKADGHSKIGVISDSGGYGKDGHDVIVKAASNLGIEIVSDQTFNIGDTDMSAQLTNIKKSGADSILMWTAGAEAVTIAKNREQLGITLPWYGGSGQARTEFPTGAGTAAEGFIFGTGKSLVPSTWGQESDEFAVVSDFAARYKASYGSDPDIFAGHAFDAVNILHDALKRVGADADGAKLNAAIEATKDLVGFGGSFTYSATDHNGLNASDLALYQIQGGTWVPIQ
jgi:branched-chain amino acid transport system substrate-binding protein